MPRRYATLRNGERRKVRDLNPGDEYQLFEADGSPANDEPADAGFWTCCTKPTVDDRPADEDGPRYSFKSIPSEHYAAWVASENRISE